MSKSLQRGILFSICVALVLALSLTLVFFAGGGDKNILSAPQGQVSNAAQNTTSYTHGSNIGRPNQTSGTPVDTPNKLVDALATSGTYYLTNDITLSSSQIFKNNTFSGTLYGNGYTITLNGKAHSTDNSPNDTRMYFVDNIGSNNAGALISKMQGGKVYDLNIQASGDFKVIGSSGNKDANVNVGLLAGWITGNSVIDNVSVTLAANSFVMAMGYGTPSQSAHTWHAVGLIGGVVDNNNTITNITATVNGIIDAGIHAGTTDYDDNYDNGNDELVHKFEKGSLWNTTTYYAGVSGAVVGKVEANTTNIKIDNIIVAGSGQMRGSCVGLVAFTSSSVGNSSTATVNIFNKTTSQMVRGQEYWSYTFLKWEANNSWTINNYYRLPNAQNDMNAGYNPQNTINVPDTQNVYFDPAPTDYANSLAVVFTGQPTIPSGYKRTYTLTSATGKQYTNQDNFIVSDNGATVVAKGLPSATSNWNSNGTFTAKLTYEDTPIFQIPDDPIPVYEHGYVPKGYSATTGSKEISTGDEFTKLFRPNGTVEQSGSYYLSEDIAISGFTGNTFNGTLDGCGHTIYIIDKIQDTYTGPNVGGLVGNLGGTIKNVRIVIDADIDFDINASSDSDIKPRAGGVVGRLNGGTLENVQVVIPSDVSLTVAAGNSKDMGMGGVVGTALGSSTMSNVTVKMDGTLAPTGTWTFVSAMVGEIPTGDNSRPTIDMDNMIVRGSGTFAAVASQGANSGEPPYVSVLANFNNKQNYEIVNLDGLIYDFTPTISGDASAFGIFVNNNSGGDVSQYGKYVADNNLFIMQGRSYNGTSTGDYDGNAPVPLDGVFKTVNTSVTGADGATVAAYFNPVDGDNDMIFRATRTTGSWMTDDMVQLVGSDGKLYQSAMEIAGEHSSPKLVYAPKGVAATDNVVQLTMPSNVFRPEFGKDVLPLTYNGQEQSFVFPLKLNNADQTPLTEDDFTVTYRLADASTGSLGSNSLPVNAGEYIATIVLKNGYKFIAEGQGTETDTYELTVEISPYTVEINTEFVFDATYGEIGLNGGVISGGKFTAENLFANHADLSSTFADIPGIAELTVAAADSSQITASGAGKLPVGSYTVAEIKLDDTNFAATDYVGTHLIAFEVTQKSVSAQIAINKDLPNAFTGVEFDLVDGDFAPTFTTLESGDVVTLEYLINDGALTIYNAGEYVFTAKIADGGDGGNYSLDSYEFTGLTDNKHTVGKYTVTGSWAFADGAALVYGTPVPDPSALITTDFSGNTVTVNESMVEVEVSLETADASWTEDMPAGTEVTVVVNIIFNDTNFEKGEITAPVSDRLTVEKADYDMTGVTFEDASFVYDGTEKTITVSGTLPTGADDIQVTVSYSGTNGTAALTNAGSTEITATFATTSTNYNVPEAMTATLTVTPKDVTFAWSVSGEIVEGMAVEDVKAMANPTNNGGILEADTYTFGVDIGDYTAETPRGTQVTFTPSVTFTEEVDEANYNITFNPETEELIVQLGEVEIAVTQATVNADYVNGYTSAAQFLANFTTSVSEVTIDGENFTVTVTHKEGDEAVGFDSLLDVGEYTVTIESSVYSLAGTTTYAYQVTATVAEISWAADTDLIYNGDEHTLTATVANKVGQDDVTVTVQRGSGNNVNVTAEGFTFTATGLTGAAEANYTIDGAENLTSETQYIARATLTVQFEGISGLEYTGTAHIVTATAAGWQKDESFDLNSLITIGGNDTQALNAGNYTATITKEALEAALGNYTLAQDATVVFTVAPATLEISAVTLGENGVYDGNEKNKFLTVTYSVPPIGEDSPTVVMAVQDYETNGFTNAGEYTVNVSLAPSDVNYKLGGTTTFTVTIERANITVTVSVEGKTYDGEAVTPSVTVMFGERELEASEYGAVTYTYAIKDGDTLDAAPADASDSAYTVTANVAESTNFNAATSAAVEFTIARKTVSVAWENTAFTYNGLAQVPTATATGLVEGDSLTLTVTGAQTDAGSYTATVAAASVTGNYVLAEDATVEFTITRKTVSVAWGNTAFTYNGSAQAPTATATGWQNGENHDSTLNGLITIGGNDTQALNAGDYTATITKEALETALDNYTLAQDASVEFTVAPATLNLTIKMKESGSGASVANQFTWNVSGKITVTKTADGWTLACGDVSYNVTVTGGEDVENLLDMLQLTLNGSEYNGTPYGTRVQNGELGVASTNPNYTVELVAPVIINIVPDISIEINTGAEYPDSAVYSKDKTYTAEDFAGYFSIDGQPDGTWDYSVEEEESGSFSDVGTYTVKATFTITASRIQLETHFTFTITQATVTGVKLNGDGVYTYGELKAGDTVSVTVTYSDGNTATVNVGFEAAESTGGYVKAGEQTIKVSYTNDDSDYAAVTEHEITVTVKKKTITATINYGEQSGTELTLTYNGSVGYTIGAKLNDVLSGDGVSAKVLQSSFIDVAAYEVEITLDGNDKDNYMVEGEYTVTITPADVTYEWNFADGAKITYGDSVEVVTALAVMPDGALLGVEGKVAFQVSVGDYSATTNAGTEVTFTVNAKLPEGAKEKNYNIIITAADGNTLTVGKATLTIAIADTASFTKVYDGDAVTLDSLLTADNVSVKGMKNGEDAFTLGILAISGTDEMTNAGTYNGSVSVIENCNYTAEAIEITYIVTPKPIDVAWSNTEFTYDGTAHKPTATATGLVDGDSLTLTVVTDAQTNAGSYTATVAAFEQGNYKLESTSTQTFTIARRGLDVAEVAEAVYGDLQVSGTLVTGTHTAFVAYNDEEIELIVNVKAAALSRAAAEYLDAGEYEVTIALVNENGNFSLNGATLNAETQKMEVPSTLDVAPKTVEVGYTTSSEVYDAKGISVTIDKFEDMLIEGDDPAVNIYINDAPYTGKVVLDAGEYTVRYESADPNYAFKPVSATFTVAPKSVTPNFDLNTGSGSQQITGGGKLEIEEGEETDIVAAIDNFMQSSGVSEEDMSISVSGDLKLEDMATWAPGTYTVTVTLSGNHSGSMQFTVEVSEKIELPPPVAPELPENPVEAGSGNDWVLPLVIAIVALIDLALLVAIGVAAKKRA